MSQFAAAVAAWAAKAEKNANLVARKVAIDVYSKIIKRSPVGNPELWASNANALENRRTYNFGAQAYNAQILANPENLTKSGKKKAGVKLVKTRSARALAQAYPLVSGKGYIGGQFRANWQLTIGSPPTSTIEAVDPKGDSTIASGSSVLTSFRVGPKIWIINNLPYGHRLEFEGWSKQAPAGMVRVTVAEYQNLVNLAAAEVNQ